MNNEQFYEIYDIYITPWWQSWEFLLPASILLLMLGILCMCWAMRKYRSRAVLPITAWEQARQNLNALDLATCSTKEDFKAFYFSLTNILKSYLDARYGWETLSLTDEEIEPYLVKKSFDKDLACEIFQLFRGSVSVRFANLNALPQQALQDLNRVKGIIEATIPYKQKSV